MRHLSAIVFAAALTVSGGCGDNIDRTVTVKGLRCEYRIEPLGIDTTSPRLSWIIESNRRGWKQSACEIMAASSEEKLDSGTADLWQTGRVASDRTVHIEYEGHALLLEGARVGQ